MKNTYKILLAFTLLSLFACDPLKDTYDELDQANTGLVKDITYTLTEDDYELVDKSYGNFNNEEEAKELTPKILAETFAYFGAGSTALITYDIYNGSSPYLSGDAEEVTVSEDEYLSLGYTYKNFDDLEADLPKYAAFKFPDASTGTYADVTHDYYNGSYTERDVVSRVVKTAAYGWKYTYELDSDLYKDFFEEPFSNFSNTDEAEEKIPVYLPTWFKFAEAGDDVLVQYIYYDGGVIEDLAHYTFDGSNWVLYGDAFQVTSSQLSFGFNGSEWIPDNTIKVKLEYPDYQAIGTATAASNPAGSASILSYSNFDISLWSSSEIFDAITAHLEDIYPDTEEGQKYLVTYDTWEPGNGVATLYVIYNGTEYILFEE
ncbi:hypothetical protein R9C00_26025 [Flammeovirgaceae bacterium SG7u.111]|nr:hypothetical protein [Flammeovirgaceae bacterium SG7u.132]WPO35157.1 hypothetical protein R9C00_26025 [Flammeovirgaceae bacterium SG7u.111]